MAFHIDGAGIVLLCERSLSRHAGDGNADAEQPTLLDFAAEPAGQAVVPQRIDGINPLRPDHFSGQDEVARAKRGVEAARDAGAS